MLATAGYMFYELCCEYLAFKELRDVAVEVTVSAFIVTLMPSINSELVHNLNFNLCLSGFFQHMDNVASRL